MKLYRFLSEEDTSAFCHKVTDALNKGWELYGTPTQTFDARRWCHALRSGRHERSRRHLYP